MNSSEGPYKVQKDIEEDDEYGEYVETWLVVGPTGHSYGDYDNPGEAEQFAGNLNAAYAAGQASQSADITYHPDDPAQPRVGGLYGASGGGLQLVNIHRVEDGYVLRCTDHDRDAALGDKELAPGAHYTIKLWESDSRWEPGNASQWVSVEERLPKKGQRCWVWRPGYDTPMEATHQPSRGEWMHGSGECFFRNITHWQPFHIPQPPTESKP